jgi:predicted neuraminidase
MKSKTVCLAAWLCLNMTSFLMSADRGSAAQPDRSSAIVLSEFLFEQAAFAASHASTIVETRDGLAAAWFGGPREGNPEVSIWFSRHDGTSWSAPRQIADGIVTEENRRYPCWNPVLFFPKEGPLHLFYKVGPRPSAWWGMLKISADNGRTWAEPRRLPKDIYGPIRNKPVQLPDGTLLCGSSTENAGWQVHMERTHTLGTSWSRTRSLNSASHFGAIQPTIFVHRTNEIQILCRTKQGRVTESWSDDEGRTWSPMQRTILPNPNSAIDGLVLKDKRALLVYNHSTDDRGLLNVSTSPDGRHWNAGIILENKPGDEYSYPAVIQTTDGLLHITYTWNRKRIKHIVLDPAKLPQRAMLDGQWPK